MAMKISPAQKSFGARIRIMHIRLSCPRKRASSICRASRSREAVPHTLFRDYWIARFRGR
jgi:hypothetical protein